MSEATEEKKVEEKVEVKLGEAWLYVVKNVKVEGKEFTVKKTIPELLPIRCECEFAGKWYLVSVQIWAKKLDVKSGYGPVMSTAMIRIVYEGNGNLDCASDVQKRLQLSGFSKA